MVTKTTATKTPATATAKKGVDLSGFLTKHSFELRGLASVLQMLLEMAPVPAAAKRHAVDVVENLYGAADSIALAVGADFDGDGRPGLHPSLTARVSVPKASEEA